MVTQRVVISDNPELLALIRTAGSDGTELLLNDGETDIAVVTPIGAPESESEARARRERDLARFMSAAGSWKDVEIEAFKARVRADRDASSRPLPDL